jgi:NADPH:quinone reductase-like Zn-dependent oxidoreductase
MDSFLTWLSHVDISAAINGAAGLAALQLARDLRKAVKLLTVRVDNHERRLEAAGL